eukprot:3922175-Lingulodinium_polyedra.AAC.1
MAAKLRSQGQSSDYGLGVAEGEAGCTRPEGSASCPPRGRPRATLRAGHVCLCRCAPPWPSERGAARRARCACAAAPPW